MPRKILLCGGGTGGHVLPLVAVAREIKKLSPETKIYFVGPEEFPLDSFKEEGIIVKKIIAAGKIRRYFSFQNFIEPLKIIPAFIQSLWMIILINPDVVLGKGSYGSVWPVLASWFMGKKIILHESDAVPGLANRFLSKFTKHIALAFLETAKCFPGKKINVVGNPVRLKYLNIPPEEATAVLNINTQRKIIFISGGSQGAQKINETVLNSIEKILEEYFVIWSTGTINHQLVKYPMFDNENLKIAPFLNEKELAAAYVLCDLAVGRAGAGTIFELAAFGKPALLIPLERKDGDQPVNAQVYTDAGGAISLKESKLNQENLMAKISEVLNRRDELSQNAKKFAKMDAAEKLAKILLNL